MARVFLLIILIWALIVVLKRVASGGTNSRQTKHEERIVQCAQCGLRIPESESMVINDRVLCNNPQCRDPA